MDYILTNNGAVLMTQVAAGKTILFTRAESGSGYAASPATLQGVIDKKQELFLDEVTYENKQAVVKTILTNMQLEEAYQLRQVGVYAKLEGDETDTLVIIGQQYNGEKIPPHHEGIINIEYEIHMKVSGTGNVTIEGVGTGYVTKAQFLTHLNDNSNPHKVTARQIGLENVQNVSTNDQTPEFEEAEERENIVSGERLAVLFGKIRKWFADLKEAAFCSVANNLVTTLPGSVLDARQGKEMQDQISALYSDIEVLRNNLSTLDTRVTNAINGGDLAAPVSYNVLLSPYTDRLYYSGDGKTYSGAGDSTASRFYNSYVRDDLYYRVWNNTYTVPKKAKLVSSISISAANNLANQKLEVLNTSNAVMLNANLNGTTDLSSLAGKTVKFRVSCSFQIHQALTVSYNSLSLTNK